MGSKREYWAKWSLLTLLKLTLDGAWIGATIMAPIVGKPELLIFLLPPSIFFLIDLYCQVLLPTHGWSGHLDWPVWMEDWHSWKYHKYYILGIQTNQADSRTPR